MYSESLLCKEMRTRSYDPKSKGKTGSKDQRLLLVCVGHQARIKLATRNHLSWSSLWLLGHDVSDQPTLGLEPLHTSLYTSSLHALHPTRQGVESPSV